MKKRAVVLLFFVAQIGFGQNQKIIDSLRNELINGKTILEKIKINYYLSLEFINKDIEQCKYYLNETEELISELKEKDTLIIKFYMTKAQYSRDRNNYELSDSLYNLSIKYAKKFNLKTNHFEISSLIGIALNKFYKGNIDEALKRYNEIEPDVILLDSTLVKSQKTYKTFYTNKAIVLANLGKIKDAFVYFKKSLIIDKKLYNSDKQKNAYEYISSLNNVALCYDYLNEFEKSIINYQMGLEVANKFNIDKQIVLINSNLSGLFLKQKEYKKAIEYGNKAIKIENNNQIAYNNIGVAYMNLSKRKLSNQYFYKALKDSKKLNRLDKIALTYTNIGINHMELQNIDSSEIYLNKGLKIYKDLGMINKMPRMNYTLGRLYLKKENYNKAIPYMLEAAKKFNESEILQEEHSGNFENLYIAYKGLGDNGKSLYFLEKTYKTTSALDSIRNKKIVYELETRYQTQQKENEILQLTNEKIVQEASLTKSRYTTFGILGALLLVLGLGYFYWNKRKQQHQMALLENSVKTSESEKSRIGKELHDGIAGTLMKLVHDSETAQIQLSHKLLQTYNEVRDLSHQLDNTPMHGELFMDRVIDVIPESSKTQQFNFEITPRHLEINEPQGTHIYRIIQELIANNIKYANATKTAIKITAEKETMTLIYEDNGIGTSNFKKGKGYKNMEDRLTLLNGTLQIETEKGFEVSIKIPYVGELS